MLFEVFGKTLARILSSYVSLTLCNEYGYLKVVLFLQSVSNYTPILSPSLFMSFECHAEQQHR